VQKVSAEEAQQWCKEHGEIPYFEVSAKEGTNVESVGQFAADIGYALKEDENLYTLHFIMLTSINALTVYTSNKKRNNTHVCSKQSVMVKNYRVQMQM
jgi:hypothetical protein